MFVQNVLDFMVWFKKVRTGCESMLSNEVRGAYYELLFEDKYGNKVEINLTSDSNRKEETKIIEKAVYSDGSLEMRWYTEKVPISKAFEEIRRKYSSYMECVKEFRIGDNILYFALVKE